VDRGGGEDGAGGVWSPAGAIEEEPAPLWDEADLVAEVLGEAEGVAVRRGESEDPLSGERVGRG